MMPKQQLWAAMVGKEFEEAGVGKVGRRWKLSPFRGRHTYIHSYIHTYLTARLMRDLFEGAGYFTLLEFIVHQLLSNKTSRSGHNLNVIQPHLDANFVSAEQRAASQVPVSQRVYHFPRRCPRPAAYVFPREYQLPTRSKCSGPGSSGRETRRTRKVRQRSNNRNGREREEKTEIEGPQGRAGWLAPYTLV